MRFRIPNLTVRFANGRVTISRPAPPAKPKPETLADLFTRRRQLEADLSAAKSKDAAAWSVPPVDKIEADIAALDSRLDLLTGV